MTVQASNLESEQIPDPTAVETAGGGAVAGKSPGRLALERFRKDRLSMVSAVVVAIYILLAIVAPLLVHFKVLDPQTFHQDLLNADTLPEGSFGGISASHPLGVEPGTGRDVLSRIVYGITFSLAVAIAATMVTMIVGTVMGIISGFAGGWTDSVIGRFIDLTLSFPQTLMLLALSDQGVSLLADVLPGESTDPLPNGAYIVLVLGLFGWPSIARVIRGQVLTIREREFVEAAKLFGAPRRRIYFKEILPNLWAPLLVNFTLIMPLYISAEAALAFLGVSIPPPTPTLGNILTGSLNYAQADFLFFSAPAVLIMIIVVCFNLLGDGIRDALDPKSAQ
ncbi:ABC transporter permease [Nocardioides fonticola]|uniref:ABC transporter permease n=1 Tax=Nocardioides fonticola TaxID=450363 RepID=A0ABP7XLN1_9ACTN